MEKYESTEVWREIPNYEGLYMASSMGRIRSLDRLSSNGRLFNGKVKSLSINVYGYLGTTLTKLGVKRAVSVHQLVAMSFLDHIPSGNKVVVDHINNIKTDNRVENLQLISTRENLSKDKKSGTSEHIGVSWYCNLGKWVSRIYINGKAKHLGYFIEEREAAQAYKIALNSHINKIKS